jgi:hypothetical protein
MAENFDEQAFAKAEVERVMSEIDAIEQREGVAVYASSSDDVNLGGFYKAMDASIDIFMEKTKHLR